MPNHWQRNIPTKGTTPMDWTDAQKVMIYGQLQQVECSKVDNASSIRTHLLRLTLSHLTLTSAELDSLAADRTFWHMS